MNTKATPWKLISSKVLLKHEGFSVVKDTLILPDGSKTDYIRRIANTDSVIVIAIDHDQRVLLQKEYSHPPNQIMWQLPGGSMQPNESVIDAANRELAEESGYQADSSAIIGSYYTNNRLWSQQQHVVACTNLKSYKLKQDHDEFIETFWVSKDEIKSRIAKNTFNNINLLAALNIWFHSH